MLKVAVALIVVVGLIASTEAWKRPGKPGRFSCDSNNLPDFVQSNLSCFLIKHFIFNCICFK